MMQNWTILEGMRLRYSGLIFCGQVFYYMSKMGTDPSVCCYQYPTREESGHLIMYGQPQLSVLQNPHTGLTACCSLLHQISPYHTYRKPHLPTNQVLHLGMLIMHIFCVVVSPFCSFSCSKLRKESAVEQRVVFFA